MFNWINPGQYLGPRGMLDLYKNIQVPVGGGFATVAVNNYRNGAYAEGKSGSCAEAIKIKNALSQASRNKAWDFAGGPVSYMNAFVGKGSPWSIQGVLEAFVAYSDAFIKSYGKAGGTVGRCAKLLADDCITWEQTLQGICDLSFGLDCNGFVGNWLKVNSPEFKITPDSKSNDVRRARPKAVYRTEVGQIEAWDVMCYVGNEHIAAIEAKGNAANSAWVCQSAGGGPRINDLGIVKVAQTKNQFRLAAPTKQDIGNAFYIVNIWY